MAPTVPVNVKDQFDGIAEVINEEKLTEVSVPHVSAADEQAQKIAKMTPAELEQYELEEEKKFFADSENKQRALELAAQIRDTLGNNWFTFSRFIKKSKEDKLMGLQKLNVLERFGYVKTKVGNFFNDGVEGRNQKMYKVFIDKSDYIAVYNQVLAYHEDQIKQIKSALKQYED